MRNKNNESDIIFHIDKEKKIVICQLTHCAMIPYKRITKLIRVGFAPKLCRDIDDSFIGMARCSPEDEWNEEYGKKLALLRARKKRAQAINAEIRRFVKKYRKILDRVEKECCSKIPSEDEL